MSERFRDYKYIGRERKESREDILGKKKKKRREDSVLKRLLK